MDKEKTVAFTGYRASKITRTSSCGDIFSVVQSSLRAVVAQLYEEGFTSFVTGGSDGFDLMAAEAVLHLRAQYSDVALMVVVPFRGQEHQYDEVDKALYNKVLTEANEVALLNERYHKTAYLQRNDYMLNRSSVVVSYYNGMRGGTMYTYNRAVKLGLRVINIFPEQQLF